VKAHRVSPEQAQATDVVGRVVAHTVRRPGEKAVLLRKGQLLTEADLALVRQVGVELHLLEPEPGDLHEDEAGRRLAQAAAGDGVGITGPTESQYQLVANRRGLFRVDVDLLRQVNAIEGLSVFTTFDRQPVEAGENIGAVKVTPLLLPGDRLAQAEALCQSRPLLAVKAFRPFRVAALIIERVDDAALERFRRSMGLKLAWFGSELSLVERVEDRVEAFVAALRSAAEARAEVVMAAGASSLDPLEPLFDALDRVGAQIVKHGVPAHPGSLFWLAYLGTVPIFGLSSCEMFSHKTILDLILPRLLAGERVGREELIEMGHGGLLARYMAFRFPPYDD
jgi:molybdopterin biosynthesis enzyme